MRASRPPPPRLGPNEVKGVWFVSARRHLEDTGKRDVLERIVERLPKEHRTAFVEPIASAWYPEEALACTLQLLREEEYAGRDERFVALMEQITHVGVNRFFRLLLGLTSVDFVLRKIPVMWSHIRRGPGRVDVESDEHGATIRYRDFVWFRDENYRLLTVGSIRALLAISGAAGDVKIAEATEETLTIAVTYSRTVPR